MKVIVTYENQTFLLAVMLFLTYYYCRFTEMNFKVGSMKYRKVLSATMVDLQEKILNSRQKSSEKAGGHDPSDSLPRFGWSCIYICHKKLASVLKLYFFHDALEGDLEMFCEIRELPRKWIEVVNKRMFITA